MANTCSRCRADNPETQRFCGECGTPLPSGNQVQGSDAPRAGGIPRSSMTETLRTPIHELATGSTFAGRYQVIEELGHGGMGKVYKVFDTDIKEKIALKLLRPEIALDKETVERFSNELKLARKISHRNVCRMFDLGKAEGTTFITMEFVPGEDLKKLIRKTGQLGAGRVVSIAKQVCEGLAEAHHLGVVHRDLKPQNIMVDEDGNARIMDFGIARPLRGKGITGPGVMIGTPEYMSPEQVEGKDIDERSDVYSLGVVLFEMVTARVPFEGDTPFTIGVKHKSEKPRNPRELNAHVPEDLSRVILRCLEKDKERRYQTAEELRAELEKVEQGLPTTERIVAQKKSFTSREITVKFNLKKLAMPLLAVTVLAASAVILWKFIPHKRVPAGSRIENSIAVISFKNQTGDPAYDYLQEAIPNLLITNLENTGLFYVATWERMQDILKQMGAKQARLIDSDLGFELCRREGIKAIAIGSFTKAGNVFRTDVKVLDVDTKGLLKSANIKGTGVDSILDTQIDSLSREMSLGLGIEKGKVEAVRLNIKEITTVSLQAYDFFLKGKEAYNLLYWEDAKKNMGKALEIDPTFAMAYVYLAWANQNTGDVKARNETIEKAMALSNKTSQKDRLYLEAGYALFIKQDPEKHYTLLKELVQKYPNEKWAFHYLGDALYIYRNDIPGAYDQFKKWLELDPQDANAINHLISASSGMREFKKAADYIKMHDAVAPPDSYNLHLQALMYRKMGQLDIAIAKNMEALEIKPDFIFSIDHLCKLYALKEEYEKSLKWANEYVSKASSAGKKASAYRGRGFYRYWLGTFEDALGDFSLAEKMAEEVENWDTKMEAAKWKGIAYVMKGDFELSRKCFDNDVGIAEEHFPEDVPTYKACAAWWMGNLAIKQGRIDQANTRLSEMKSFLPIVGEDSKAFVILWHDLLQGEVFLAQGSLDAALSVSQKACRPGSPFQDDSMYYMDLLARVYAKKGDAGKAIAEYERLFKQDVSADVTYLVHPLYHYRLGLLYERSGEVAKAKAQYLKFLDLWKDADPGQAEVDDAKTRLKALL
jgi:serine/threonine protein kinase/Tfp pilus assembly protein PilF